MGDWRSTASRVLGWLGRGLEVAAGLGVLLAVWLLVDLRAAPETEAAGTFVVGFLFLWAGSLGGLAVLAGGRVSVWMSRQGDGRTVDRLRGLAVRLGLELGLASVVVIATVPSEYLGDGGFSIVTTASAVVAVAVIGHHGLTLVQDGRSVLNR